MRSSISQSHEGDGLIQYNDGFLKNSQSKLNSSTSTSSLSMGAEGQGTVSSSVINLAATAMGAGILSLPKALSELGIGLGLVLLVFFALLSDLSLILLVDCSRITRRNSFEGVGEEACGKCGKFLVKFTLLLFLFGSVILLMTIFGDLVFKSMQNLFHISHSVFYGKQVFFMGILSIGIFPLCLAQNISILKYTSFMGLCFLFYVVSMSIVYFFTECHATINPSVSVVKITASSGLGLPLLYLPYASQFNIFAIHEELAVKQDINKVIHYSILGFVTTSYICGAIFGYITWGADVNANLLLEYPGYYPATIGRLAIGFTNVLKLPLIVMPFRTIILRTVSEKGHATGGFLGVFLLTLAIMTTCFFIAFGLASIEKELELLGAVAGSLCCFILPSLFYLKLSTLFTTEFASNPGHKYKTIIAYIMFFLSIVVGIYALILTLIHWSDPE